MFSSSNFKNLPLWTQM